jgi:hypothetical protein
MADTDLYLTTLKCVVDVGNDVKEELQLNELYLTESLMTPGLQTTLIAQNRINVPSGLKNLDELRGATVHIEAERPIIKKFYTDIKSDFVTNQKIYRLSNRELLSYNVEDLQLDACDPTLIADALTFVSKSWSCQTASDVVYDVLQHCIQPQNMEIEDSFPPKDYIAENIHPFQIVTQQAEGTLSMSKMDPSFVHFMTYQNTDHTDIPTHNFKAVSTLSSQPSMFTFTYSAKTGVDQNYAKPSDIMKYSFPCDFDLLSDALNGFDENGNEILSLISYNPFSGTVSNFGPMGDCGISPFSAATNLGTAEDQASCNTDIEKFLIKRKARMALLEQDKIALRMTVPFSPFLNVGRVITAKFINSADSGETYGSGDYLIVNMTHNIKIGGFGTTVLDCVSNTVAAGIV